LLLKIFDLIFFASFVSPRNSKTPLTLIFLASRPMSEEACGNFLGRKGKGKGEKFVD